MRDLGRRHHQSLKSAKGVVSNRMPSFLSSVFECNKGAYKIPRRIVNGGPTSDLFDKKKSVTDILLFSLLYFFLLTSWPMICFVLCIVSDVFVLNFGLVIYYPRGKKKRKVRDGNRI